MNREIKFRAWDKSRNEMYFPHTLQINPETKSFGSIRFHADAMDDSILMAFTGLKDKNGKEIYEGDIVQFDTWSKKGVKEVVQFEHGAFMPFFDPHYCDDEQGDHFSDDTIGVIGNIFENPELVK